MTYLSVNTFVNVCSVYYSNTFVNYIIYAQNLVPKFYVSYALNIVNSYLLFSTYSNNSTIS